MLPSIHPRPLWALQPFVKRVEKVKSGKNTFESPYLDSESPYGSTMLSDASTLDADSVPGLILNASCPVPFVSLLALATEVQSRNSLSVSLIVSIPPKKMKGKFEAKNQITFFRPPAVPLLPRLALRHLGQSCLLGPRRNEEPRFCCF